jgi:hypothetical protein
MRNITITMPDDVAARARVEAFELRIINPFRIRPAALLTN